MIFYFCLPLTIGIVVNRPILGRLIVPVAVQQAVTQGGQADQAQQPAGAVIGPPPVTGPKSAVEVRMWVVMHVSHFIISIS